MWRASRSQSALRIQYSGYGGPECDMILGHLRHARNFRRPKIFLRACVRKVNKVNARKYSSQYKNIYVTTVRGRAKYFAYEIFANYGSLLANLELCVTFPETNKTALYL